jgi:hypothetical protein
MERYVIIIEVSLSVKKVSKGEKKDKVHILESSGNSDLFKWKCNLGYMADRCMQWDTKLPCKYNYHYSLKG